MINQEFDSITSPFLRGKTSCGLVNEETRTKEDNSTPVIVRTTYINYLSVNVSLMMRSGVRFSVPPIASTIKDKFIIRNHYSCLKQAKDEMLSSLHMTGNLGTTYQKTLELAMHQNLHETQYSNIRFEVAIDTIVDLATLSGSNSCYLTDHDIVLSTKVPLASASHPFSNHTVVVDKFKERSTLSNALNYFVEIIDNENQLKNRFMLIGGDIQEIRTIKDINRVTGVYFGTYVNGLDGKLEVKTKQYSIEDAQNVLGIFTTMEEALTGGSQEFIQKKKIEEVKALKTQTELDSIMFKADNSKQENEYKKMENEFKLMLMEKEKTLKEITMRQSEFETLMKNKMMEEKASYDKLVMDMSTKYEKQKMKMALRHDKDKKKLESKKSRRDDYYDERSVQRKEKTEWSKAAPAIIVGALTLGALFFKFA